MSSQLIPAITAFFHRSPALQALRRRIRECRRRWLYKTADFVGYQPTRETCSVGGTERRRDDSTAQLQTSVQRLFSAGEPGGSYANLLRGASGIAALNVTAIAMSFVNAVLLARLLGSHGYGIYNFALAIATLIAVPATLGLNQVSIRDVAKYQAAGEWSLLRGLVSRANQAVALSGLAICAFAFIISRHVTRSEYSSTLLVALLLVPLLSLASNVSASLRGLRHPVLAQIPDGVLRPAILTGCVLTAAGLVGAGSIGPTDAMALHAVAGLIACVTLVTILRSKLPVAAKRAAPQYRTREWIVGAIPFMLISGTQVIIAKTDIVILGAFRPAEEVGVYRGALQFALLVAFPLQVANLLLPPYFSRLWQQGRVEGLQDLATLSARAILIVTMPIMLGILAYGDDLLALTLGPEFFAGGTPLVLLGIGQLASASVGSVGSLLSMTGNERFAAKAIALAAVVNCSLNVLLIPRWGISGAAFATATAVAISNIYMAAIAWRKLGVDCTPFGLSDRRIDS